MQLFWQLLCYYNTKDNYHDICPLVIHLPFEDFIIHCHSTTNWFETALKKVNLPH